MIESLSTGRLAAWYLDAGMTAAHRDASEVVLSVPRCFQLDAYSCGLVAAMVVVRHFDPNADLRPLAKILRPSRTTGCDEPFLIKALGRYGVKVTHLEEPSFADIDSELRQGHPLIAAIRGRWFDIGHWAVIYGARRRDEPVLTCHR